MSYVNYLTFKYFVGLTQLKEADEFFWNDSNSLECF